MMETTRGLMRERMIMDSLVTACHIESPSVLSACHTSCNDLLTFTPKQTLFYKHYSI